MPHSRSGWPQPRPALTVEKDDIQAYRWLFSIQIRTPVAVETWTEPLAALEARMSEDAKEDGRIQAWNHVYRELRSGWSQTEFDSDNANVKGPIRKGHYRIEDGPLIMSSSVSNE